MNERTAEMFQGMLREGVRAEVGKILKEEEAAAMQRIKERIAGLAGRVAMELSNIYTVERMGPEIVIRVIMPEAKP